MNQTKILYSVPSQTHINLGLDEIEGLTELGYSCEQFPYHAKDGFESKLARLYIIIKNALTLVKLSKRFHPDIIYFNSRLEVKAGIRDYITIKLFRSLYKRKVLILLKSHGSEIGTLNSESKFIRNVVMPFLRKNISGWLFLSSEEKSKIDAINYFEPQKVFVAKNIVRAWQFSKDAGFREQIGVPGDHKILLYVGRIVEVKGVFDILEAYKSIQDKYKTTLVIVGDGFALEPLKQKAAALGLDGRIIFTGKLPEKEVVPYYSNSDILVFPTYDQEGFPMALFNSVAAGISIVATPIRAATDYLTEPENCLWAEAKNPDSIAKAVARLLESHELRDTMHKNNLAKSHLFSKETVCREISDIIFKVIEQNN
ncbi:MAG: glycosyl transferase group 1 [Sphingobacteriaceae bacterium]|jgi:glycosyltransferase involved in cell wall biosynthesis|nr:glycosyl transferase group 1 [Sphingobacteriaceae bacterium]